MKTERVFVIGGGPAGLAAAIAARLERFEVTLADPHQPPIDKACGEGIMPDGVRILSRLGVRLAGEETFPFRGIRYLEGSTTASGRFRGTPGLGVRRTILHGALHRRARELGVEFLWGHKVVEVSDGSVELESGSVPARWVIAADGQGSCLRAALGLDTPPLSRRYGVRRHYRVEPWCDLVEVYWSTGCEFYVTPVSGHEMCVAALTGDPHLKFDTALARFPSLAGHLAGAPIVSDTLGGLSVYRRSRAVVRGNVALLGDASGSLDALTGAGVTLALQQALMLAGALRDGDLGLYARAYPALMRLPNRTTTMMLAINHRTWLRRLTLRALSAIPGFFSLLLALLTRTKKQLAPALRAAFFLLSVALVGAPSLWASSQVLRLDPEKTQIEFLLGATMHRVEGTVKLSHGEIRFDLSTGEATGEIVADATSASTASRKRDKKMHEKVLESALYPDIVFYPEQIEGSLQPQGESELRISGIFLLHGDRHDLVMSARVQMNGGRLTGTATFNIPYVSWGLEDPSIFVLRVRKDVDITLRFTGTLEPAVAEGSPPASKAPADPQDGRCAPAPGASRTRFTTFGSSLPCRPP